LGGGGAGPLGRTDPRVEVDPQVAKNLQEEVEVDFWLEVQVCLSMLPSQVPLGTHGTHYGVHHQHPLPMWFFHQGKRCHTQFTLLG
jgi:hypothetical protein